MEETLGKRIVQNRKRLGLTQDALAERLGVTAQAVSKWENDQSCPDITMLPRLAEIFGITTDALLGLEAPAKEAELVEEDAAGLHVDHNDGRWEFHWDGGRKSNIGIGLWVIAAGAMLLGANFLGQQVSLWTALWTTGLTIFGLFGLWPKFSCFRLGCALAGGYYLVNELWPRLFVLEKGFILPILLLLFGLSLLLDAGKKGKKPVFSITSQAKGKQRQHFLVTEERFDCDVSFGEQSYLINIPRLRGGAADVSFGELTVDLRGCESFGENCHLDLNCSFGELILLVPSSVRAEPSSSTAFGNFTVTGQPNPDASDIIYVNCDASFGEITLRYM